MPNASEDAEKLGTFLMGMQSGPPTLEISVTVFFKKLSVQPLYNPEIAWQTFISDK